MKYHIKKCKKFKQLSYDVFNNCILLFVRIDKLKDCINKKIYFLIKNKKKLIFNYYPYQIDNSYINYKWVINKKKNNSFNHMNIIKNYLKIVPENKNNVFFLSLGRSNIKYFAVIDKNFTRINFLYHKYTKENRKVFLYSGFNINVIEQYLTFSGINLLFEIANIHISFSKLKNKIDIIYK